MHPHQSAIQHCVAQYCPQAPTHPWSGVFGVVGASMSEWGYQVFLCSTERDTLARPRNFGAGKENPLDPCYPRSRKALATTAGATRERGGLFVEGAFRP